ncbi:hypothetical protein QBC40DRAFT_340176 [Triangularia verruculosa]|uniref:DUF6604 domain-containing protein n=1 Tax=Triangularia verruculosa TaxID=2587418 RepID=A0AAN6XK88_9PEZI|nr:hypothetical protein QBC40DRAFT_340176 [Triangularia verruculosa]
MAIRNTYLQYKRDTSLLLRWMIKTSNNIIKSSMLLRPDGEPREINRTGQIAVTDFVPLCQFIAEHVINISPSIHRLFRSIIDARTASHGFFQQIAAITSDKKIEQSNATHKFFIDTLIEALKVLGGTFDEARVDQPADQDTTPVTEEEVEQLISANRFAALQVQDNCKTANQDDESSDEGSESQRQPPATHRRKKSRSGKGKRGKRNAQRKKSSMSSTSSEDLPLGEYKFTSEPDSCHEEYYAACFNVVHSWMLLRQDLQEVWRDVAYKNLNVAVAGTLSNLAISMVKRFATAVFVNFPDHDSYETISNGVTRGYSLEQQEQLLVYAWALITINHHGKAPAEMPRIDVQEQLMLHTYQHLVDFITDFQYTRSGRPTKRMLIELNTWKPDLNLEKATKSERITWRRSYTINWLYEMVNVHLQPGPGRRNILGLQEFAGFITSLAMRKPGTEISSKILPHHVFQLQLMVDSMTISRGWSVGFLEGDLLESPARGFSAERDITARFLNPNMGKSGLIASLAVFRDIWGVSNNEQLRNSANPLRTEVAILNDLVDGLQDSLGQNPEPLILGHLYNMLLNRGYIKSPRGIWALFLHLFKGCIFPDGKAPSSDYHQALLSLLHESAKSSCQKSSSRHRDLLRQWRSQGISPHHELDVGAYSIFSRKSNAVIYREAKWDIDHIPVKDLDLRSSLASIQLLATKRFRDSTTGRMRLDDTELTRRYTASGSTEEGILKSLSIADEGLGGFGKTSRTSTQDSKARRAANDINDGYAVTDRMWLKILKCDIINDFMGDHPLSGANYLGMLVASTVLFRRMFVILGERRNATWMRVLDTHILPCRDAAFALALEAVDPKNQDEELLKVFAETLEAISPPRDFYLHWDYVNYRRLEEELEKGKISNGKGEDSLDANICCVM